MSEIVDFYGFIIIIISVLRFPDCQKAEGISQLDNIDIQDILDDLQQKKTQVDSNESQAAKLKKENSRIIADMISTINDNKEPIIDTIHKNEDYLKLIPNFPYFAVEEIICKSSKSGLCKDDADKMELIIDTLNEIKLHNLNRKDRKSTKPSIKSVDRVIDFIRGEN